MGKKSNGIRNFDNKTVVFSFVDISFGRLFNLYKRWSWIDPYYSVAFVYGVLVASSINFIFAVLYYISGHDLFAFRFYPTWLILFLFVWVIYYYFHRNKVRYREVINKLPENYSIKDYLVMGVVILMFSTWFISPVIYKWGSNIH